MPSTVILGTARTPFGKMGGALSSLDATDLGGNVIEAALERSGVEPEQVEQVIFGQVLQAGQGQIPSRQAQIKAGIPKEVPSETINKVCASGMRSLGLADQAIRAGDLEVAVTGGMESMSKAPYLLPGARFGFRMGDVAGDRRDDPRRAHQPLHRQADDQRGERGIERARDHPGRHGPLRRPAPTSSPPKATDEGRLAEEIVGVTVKTRKGETAVAVDEAIRPETDGRDAAKLRAVGGEDATHTAGNSPGVNDGAGAIVVASEEWAASNGRTADRQGRSPTARSPTISPTWPAPRPTPPSRRWRRSASRPRTWISGRSTRRSPRSRSTRCGCSGSTRRRSTSTAARSPSATRSAPPEPGSSAPWSTSCAAAAAASAAPRSAPAAARATRSCSR